MAAPKGKWEDYDFVYDMWWCSNCGRYITGKQPDICPHCGAIMEKGEYEEEDILKKIIMKWFGRGKDGESMGDD